MGRGGFESWELVWTGLPAVLERPRFIPSFFSSPLLLPPTVNAALNSEIAGRKLIAANLRRVAQVTAQCRGS